MKAYLAQAVLLAKRLWGIYAVRAFVRDAVEGAVTAVAALNLVLPKDLPQAQGEASLVAIAVGAAVVAEARRDLLPLVVAWFKSATS